MTLPTSVYVGTVVDGDKPIFAVVGGGVDRRKGFTTRGATARLRGAHPLDGAQVVWPLHVRAIERLLKRDLRNGHVGKLIAQREFLAQGQTDHARELELHLLRIVVRYGHALALRTEANLRPQHLDSGDDAALPQILRLREERLGGVALRARRLGTRVGRQHLQVHVGCQQRYQITPAPVGETHCVLVVPFRPCLVQCAKVKDRLAQKTRGRRRR